MEVLMTQILLVFSHWIHLIATVTWMGAIILFYLVIKPSADKSLSPQMNWAFFNSFWQKLRPIIYFSIVAFLFSGVIITFVAGNPYLYLDVYPWAVVSLIKHIVVAALMVAGVYNVEIFRPKYNKLMSEIPKKEPNPELEKLESLHQKGAMLSVLAVLTILFLSAILLVI